MTRIRFPWSVLVLAALVLNLGTRCTLAASTPPLLVVGHVSSTSARILYDQVPSSSGLRLRIYTAPSGVQHLAYELDREVDVAPPDSGADPDRPRIVTLGSLRPDAFHLVEFRILNQSDVDEQVVRFRTAPDPHLSHPESDSDMDPVLNRVLVVSCDRFVDDQDSALWHRIVRDKEQHAATYFGMVHIGDQVYVDAGPRRVRIEPIPPVHRQDPKWMRDRFVRTVRDFRRIYRETWGRPIVQEMLRSGAHWMLPDDHEILNNVNAELVRDAFPQNPTPDLDPASENENENENVTAHRAALELHYRAGLQVMYEYQFQLRRNVEWTSVDFFRDPIRTVLVRYPLYYDVQIDHLKLFLLDLRFDRSFAPDAAISDALVTSGQMQALRTRLDEWKQDPNNAAVVLTGMPLFFHSPLSARLAYKMEREMYPGFAGQQRGLEELFRLFQTYNPEENPLLRLLVGGDAHTLVHSRVCGYGEAERWSCLDQLITSGVTVGSTAMNDTKLMPFYYWITRLQPVVDHVTSLIQRKPLPWTLSTDRLFFGRNYGIVELTKAGTFHWSSEVAPHESWRNVATQWMFDYALLPSVMATGFLLFVSVLAIRRRRRQHAKED